MYTTYTYVYDGAGNKLSVAYKSGAVTSKMDYAGNKVYNNGTLSMILTEEGYVTLGTTPTYYYYLKDHQGNNRVVINQGGAVQQVNHYYAFGGLFGEGVQTVSQRYRYNGKELDTELGLDMYDYGARHYDAALGRWFTVDPLAEKYYGISLYVYVVNNPVRFIDPDGRQVVGITKDDALKVQQDLNTMFAGEQFDQFRGLFTLDKKGTTFNSISADAITGAFEGITLSADQQALVNEVTGVINSTDVHKVEYVSIDGSVSKEGTSAFKTHLNNTQAGVGDAMIPSSNMPGSTMNAVSGGGINIPTKNGSHSVIMEGKGVTHDGGRALTTGHEIVGHGPASAKRVSPLENNTRAIRVDNLIRRVMGITTFRTEHGGATIVNPYALP